MSAINAKLATWLLDSSNTKGSLAEALGLSTNTLTNRIEGKSEWKWDEVCKMADFLGCQLQELRDK